MENSTRLELEAKLETAMAALRKAEECATAGQLALEVMHELRNPLEALGYLTYLTLQDANYPEKIKEHMSQAEEQLATLKRIATQTLGFTKSSGYPRKMDLAELAEAALRIHRGTIESRKVKLVKDFPGNQIAEVHIGEMLQVVSNLLANALDALPPEGTISFRVRKKAGEVHFIIADNGPGIPGEHAELIFEPFFTTKGEHGTGLGLSISRSIVERHHGKIRLRSSVRPGKSGTVFKVSVPAKPRDPAGWPGQEPR